MSEPYFPVSGVHNGVLATESYQSPYLRLMAALEAVLKDVDCPVEGECWAIKMELIDELRAAYEPFRNDD